LIRALFVALAAAVAAAGFTAVGAPAHATQSEPASVWLTHLNEVRALAGAPAVTEDVTLSAGDAKHITYMLAHGLTHYELPTDPEYTPEGAAAGRNSELARIDGIPDPVYAIDMWATSPYHAVAMLDPVLTRVGYADVNRDDADAFYALDTKSARTGSSGAGITYPQGDQVPYTAFPGHESPDPLAYCPTLVDGQVGAPIIASFPGHTTAPSQAKLYRVAVDGTQSPVEACTLSAAQGMDLNAVALMPVGQLVRGSRYRAVITVDGITKDWTFGIAKASVTLGYGGPVFGGPVIYGSPQQLSGSAQGAEDDAPVTIDYRIPGQGAWTAAGSATVHGGGFGFTFTPPAATQVQLRFTYPGTATTASASATFTVALTAPDTTDPDPAGTAPSAGPSCTPGGRQLTSWKTSGTTWIRPHRSKVDKVTVRPGFGTVWLLRAKTRSGHYKSVASFPVRSDHTVRIRVPAKAGFYEVVVPDRDGCAGTLSAAKKVRVRH
jgi:hypothetical protein